MSAAGQFLEIEKKYLVRLRPHGRDVLQGCAFRNYEQAYLVTGGTEVRIRRDGIGGRGADSYRLALKRGTGFIRDEVEVPVDEDSGRRLFEMAGPNFLIKRRYELRNEWVLDELLGRHTGMWILEIELPHPDCGLPHFPWFLDVVDDVSTLAEWKTQSIACSRSRIFY